MVIQANFMCMYVCVYIHTLKHTYYVTKIVADSSFLQELAKEMGAAFFLLLSLCKKYFISFVRFGTT